MRRSVSLLVLAAAAWAQPGNAINVVNFSGSVHSIMKIDPSGKVLTTTPLAAAFPFCLAVDPSGNVWAGSNGTQVAKLDGAGNLIGTFTVGSFPQGIASDASGNIWVSNRTSNSVMKLDTAGNILTTTPVPTAATPIGITVDQGGNAWVSGFGSAASHNMVKLDNAGNIVGSFNTPSPAGFGFSFPTVGLNGNIWVAHQTRVSLFQINSAGGLVNETPLPGGGLPRGCYADGLNFCWVANQGGSFHKVDQTGTVVLTIPPTGLGTLTSAGVDGYGDVWLFGSRATKFWQVDGTQLTSVVLPASSSAWAGDMTGFHNAGNLNPSGDYDGDAASNLAEITAGTNPMDNTSTPLNPLPIQSGIATAGASVRIGVRHRSDAGLVYVMGASFGTSPGIPVDSRVIPLNVDALLLLSLTTPVIFANFLGVLNGTGDALATINLPAATPVGFSFFVAFVTLDGAAPSGIRRISNALNITVQ